jgi:hypothetical protein
MTFAVDVTKTHEYQYLYEKYRYIVESRADGLHPIPDESVLSCMNELDQLWSVFHQYMDYNFGYPAKERRLLIDFVRIASNNIRKKYSNDAIGNIKDLRYEIIDDNVEQEDDDGNIDYTINHFPNVIITNTQTNTKYRFSFMDSFSEDVLERLK